jgi:hypothetical protein
MQFFPIFISLVMLLISCNKEPSGEQPTRDGLVSLYNFQGNSDDVFADNNGMGSSIKYLIAGINKNNQVLSLNGFNSYVKFPDSFDYEVKTINLWFNVIKPTTVLGVIYSSDNPGLIYGLTLLNTQLINSHLNLYFNVSNQQDIVEIKANTWYNATIVIEGKKYSYYLNGISVKSGEFRNYISSYNGIHESIIGCDRTLNGRFFNGLVDDLRIYNRKLSDHEIEVLYWAKF